MLKALHGWYQWKAEIESNLEVPSIQSTFWVMWRKFNIKLSHSVFTWPLFVRKCLFFQTNQPFTQTCDICTHIVSYMVGKLLKRSTFLRTQLHSYDANLKSYEFIPHAGISYMWDLTPHLDWLQSIPSCGPPPSVQAHGLPRACCGGRQASPGTCLHTSQPLQGDPLSKVVRTRHSGL